MREYLEIGNVPNDEDCVQFGAHYSATQAIKEVNEYLRMMRQKFPKLDFRIKREYHSYGIERYVAVFYDPENEYEVNQAYIASDGLDKWDELAKIRLGLIKYIG